MSLRVGVAEARCSFPGPWELGLSAGGSVLLALFVRASQTSGGGGPGDRASFAALLCFFITWGSGANGTDLSKLLGSIGVESTLKNLNVTICY